MQVKQIEVTKNKIKDKIERGDYVILAKILGIERQAALVRYRRNNEQSVIIMSAIIKNREKLIKRLKKSIE